MYRPHTNDIHHPTLRFMHKWLGFTLFPRLDFRTVRVDDLKLLYASVKRRKVSPVKSPVRENTSKQWRILDLTGGTFLLLTKAYNSLRSSTLTVPKSELGNKVKSSHLCTNRNVGWWISLIQVWYILAFPEISLQNFNLSKSCKAWSKSTAHCELNPRSKLNSF